MEEQTVVLANGDHSVIIDEVEIKQVDVETSTVAELTGNRSMSAGDTSRECESVRMLEQLMQQHKTVYRCGCVCGGGVVIGVIHRARGDVGIHSMHNRKYNKCATLIIAPNRTV